MFVRSILHSFVLFSYSKLKHFTNPSHNFTHRLLFHVCSYLEDISLPIRYFNTRLECCCNDKVRMIKHVKNTIRVCNTYFPGSAIKQTFLFLNGFDCQRLTMSTISWWLKELWKLMKVYGVLKLLMQIL